jgi:hypothetical protein
MMDWRGVSQLARAAGAEIGEGLLGNPVKPARFDVPLDPFIEASGLESLEPSPELGQLIGRQFSDGLFEVFKGHHDRQAIKSAFARHFFPPLQF